MVNIMFKVDMVHESPKPYGLGMQQYQHRFFNESPTMKRHMTKIIEDNNATYTLLNKEEPFRPNICNTNKSYNAEPHQESTIEGFHSKVVEAVENGITYILNAILTIIFIAFIGNLMWICFFEGSPKVTINRSEN